MNSKLLLCFSSAVVAMVAFADPNAPQVTLLSVSQDSASHLVKAAYTLDEPAIVTFDVLTNNVSIGGENLTHAYGDVHRVVEAGTHTLYWQSDKAWHGHRLSSADFSVVAWATNAPPDYMVVDLVVKKGARTYYIDPLQLPDGGVTNKKYKTDYLVMRRIPAKDAVFPMGYFYADTDQSCVYHRVKLTNDFYMAVFETTLGQLKNAIGEKPSDLANYYCASYFKDTEFAGYTNNLANPVPHTPYFKFRGFGSGSTWGGVYSHAISDTGSFLYRLRNALELPTLDLPTDAEWEFACRAGTATTRYDGSSSWPDDIAWTQNNAVKFAPGTWIGTWYMPSEVGMLKPNAFGLYDMIGNVKEMCLDLYGEGSAYTGDAVTFDVNADPIVAPVGPATDIKGNADGYSCGSYSTYTQAGLWGNDPNSTRRVARGGCVSDENWRIWAHSRTPVGSSKCNAAWSDGDHDTRGPYGYRLVCLP